MDIINASNMLSNLDLKFTADNMSVDILWFRAMVRDGAWSINRHKHSSYEFHFIKSGMCKIILDNDEFSVKSGNIYITAPGIYHEQIGIEGERFIEYSLNCDLRLTDYEPSELTAVLNILNTEPCKSVKDSFHAIDFFDAALGEISCKEVGYFNIIKNLAVMIFITAVRDICGGNSNGYAVPLKSQNIDHRYIMIEKYIEDNISIQITVSDISKFMYLSEKQVSRIINKEKGISAKQLIDFLKLKKAKDILKNTDIPIKLISEQLGFASESYFIQFFRRFESCPPGLYRNTVRNV